MSIFNHDFIQLAVLKAFFKVNEYCHAGNVLQLSYLYDVINEYNAPSYNSSPSRSQFGHHLLVWGGLQQSF